MLQWGVTDGVADEVVEQRAQVNLSMQGPGSEQPVDVTKAQTAPPVALALFQRSRKVNVIVNTHDAASLNVIESLDRVHSPERLFQTMDDFVIDHCKDVTVLLPPLPTMNIW